MRIPPGPISILCDIAGLDDRKTAASANMASGKVLIVNPPNAWIDQPKWTALERLPITSNLIATGTHDDQRILRPLDGHHQRIESRRGAAGTLARTGTFQVSCLVNPSLAARGQFCSRRFSQAI